MEVPTNEISPEVDRNLLYEQITDEIKSFASGKSESYEPVLLCDEVGDIVKSYKPIKLSRGSVYVSVPVHLPAPKERSHYPRYIVGVTSGPREQEVATFFIFGSKQNGYALYDPDGEELSGEKLELVKSVVLGI